MNLKQPFETRAKTFIKSCIKDPLQFLGGESCLCPVCGFSGRFLTMGTPIRRSARCPMCLSAERHRLLSIALGLGDRFLLQDKEVLHFAPEPFIRAQAARCRRYVTADLYQRDIDAKLDISRMDIADGSFDIVIANHVLEHVADDFKAIAEVYRVLRPSGLLIVMVPIVFGWDTTFEDASITDGSERRRHFGQADHLRVYGGDFPRRLESGGFRVEAFQANPRDEVRYHLARGGKVFFAYKPARQQE